MIITPYSVVMSILWFSLSCLIGSIILPKVSKGGLVLIAVIFILVSVYIWPMPSVSLDSGSTDSAILAGKKAYITACVPPQLLCV